jgi:hypothetical protein
VKALTLHAPWAHAVAHLGKDIENRTWRPPASVIGTRIAIHAGATATDAEYFALARITRTDSFDGVHRGFVVATAVVNEVVTESDSPWWIGPIGWVLSDVRALATPVPCKGRLGLWTLPDDVAAKVGAL